MELGVVRLDFCSMFVKFLLKNRAINLHQLQMSKSEIKNISEQLEMPFDEYLKQCKEALTTHNGQKGIVYAVENGGFTWKKIMDEDSGIKVKMGTVSLEPVSFVDTIQNMVTVALNCNNKLQMELNEIQSEQQKIISGK